MKIIREGYVSKYWPWSEQWICPKCHCTFEVDEDDGATITKITERQPGGASYEAAITCPQEGCGSTVTVYDWRSAFR